MINVKKNNKRKKEKKRSLAHISIPQNVPVINTTLLRMMIQHQCEPDWHLNKVLPLVASGSVCAWPGTEARKVQCGSAITWTPEGDLCTQLKAFLRLWPAPSTFLGNFTPIPSQRHFRRICTSVSLGEVRRSHKNLKVWRGSLRRRWLMSIQSVPRPTPALPVGPCFSLRLCKCRPRLHLDERGAEKQNHTFIPFVTPRSEATSVLFPFQQSIILILWTVHRSSHVIGKSHTLAHYLTERQAF